jgi:hypothetical protein
MKQQDDFDLQQGAAVAPVPAAVPQDEPWAPEPLEAATWDDMCEAGPVKQKVIEFPSGRRTVDYRPFLSFEDSVKLSDRFNMGDRKHRKSAGYMVAMLEKVMVRPRIETERDRQLVLKARSDVLLEIIAETIGSESEEMEALRADLNP